MFNHENTDEQFMLNEQTTTSNMKDMKHCKQVQRSNNCKRILRNKAKCSGIIPENVFADCESKNIQNSNVDKAKIENLAFQMNSNPNTITQQKINILQKACNKSNMGLQGEALPACTSDLNKFKNLLKQQNKSKRLQGKKTPDTTTEKKETVVQNLDQQKKMDPFKSAVRLNKAKNKFMKTQSQPKIRNKAKDKFMKTQSQQRPRPRNRTPLGKRPQNKKPVKKRS